MSEPSSDYPYPAIEELPGDLRLIAEVIGVEPTLRLARAFGGTPLYIIKIDRYENRLRNKQIREEFDRRTVQGESATKVVTDISRRQGMPCIRQLWNIVNAPDERQMGLWG